ncbi:hypothetical protein CS063_02335 [Sporanaerobium hydrogeniformans]|uniref:Uncharacterized protein n=2 Tax=Sporanaerobium hydrogeniformans TaxID=3072179 RepID=A0AC61DHS1_9FIRM|nr:hypothetical protein CS063_02335 [Sporanaerobium hydrogeniformans]
MIELIIVLAIMGILGAVLVPSFINMRNNAKITGDITTIKTVQRAMDVYFIDLDTDKIGTGSNLITKGEGLGATPSKTATSSNLLTDSTGIIKALHDAGYMDTTQQNLQVSNAGIGYDGNHLFLEIPNKLLDKYNDSAKNKDQGWLK